MDYDSVHNYYERLVFNEISDHYNDKDLADEQLADLACLALNRIPPRYIRYDIDMSFFLSTDERLEIDAMVRNAVEEAYNQLKS